MRRWGVRRKSSIAEKPVPSYHVYAGLIFQSMCQINRDNQVLNFFPQIWPEIVEVSGQRKNIEGCDLLSACILPDEAVQKLVEPLIGILTFDRFFSSPKQPSLMEQCLQIETILLPGTSPLSSHLPLPANRFQKASFLLLATGPCLGLQATEQNTPNRC